MSWVHLEARTFASGFVMILNDIIAFKVLQLFIYIS
nr:MAG TPA: hypothetical protein [Caudoviricetes sp.]